MNQYFMFVFLFLISSVISCKRDSDKMDILLNSDNKDKIMNVCNSLNKNDREFIPYLIYNLNDPRISHQYKHLGMSVYYVKAITLTKLLNLKKITYLNYKPDTSIINYLTQEAINAGYKKQIDSLLTLKK